MANLTGVKRFNIFAPFRKILKKADEFAKKVDSLRFAYRKLSNEELSKKTKEFEQKLADKTSLDTILVDVIATVREAIYRVTGLFAYKVQVIGAYILYIGDFAELYTGEGKTIVCIMSAYANALAHQGVHIVTVNEYLVQRDAKFCAECLNPLGITVGFNLTTLKPEQKREAFNCDITYTTHSELGFDYLRDNMVRNYQDKVIRTLSYAIVDEGDSILIDEARTPLIISGMPKRDTSLYIDVDKFVKKLVSADYKIDPETNTISLTGSGVLKAEEHFKLKNYYLIENSFLVHKIKNSLLANFVFQEGKEYIVRDGKIALVDQFTGRILEGRSYNAGLHQAIQAKEYVAIDPENMVVATITYQSFFRMYQKLAACSGTALTEDEEFMSIYNMVVVPVPTNKPIIRVDHSDYIFTNKKSKWNHVVAEIENVHKKGQPVLVGTFSVEASEELANYLQNKGLQFELLNAKNHMRESEIIKNAGRLGAITIATNMAGRGTDIKIDEQVKAVGGLYMLGTEHSESRRVDNQLRGRSGRQGDIGETRFFISIDDELFRRYALDRIQKIIAKSNDEFIDSRFYTTIINALQKKVEGFNFDMRKNLIDYDSVLSNQRELIYRQRDTILLNADNAEILNNMCVTCAKDIVNTNIDENNGVYAKAENITSILNKVIFNQEMINKDFFEHKTISNSIDEIAHILQVSVAKRISELGPNQAPQLIKSLLIQNLDHQWMNHLDLLTKIREGVSLRSLEQRSPLNIYVEEADKQFENLKLSVARGMIITLHRYSVPNANREFIKHFIATNPAILTQPMIDNYLPDDVKKEFNKDQITVNEISSNENKELEK